MLKQRLALELDQDINRVDSRVNKIAQDEIDDAIAATKRHRGFRPLLRKRRKAGSLAAREHKRQNTKLHIKTYPRSIDSFPANRVSFRILMIPIECEFDE